MDCKNVVVELCEKYLLQTILRTDSLMVLWVRNSAEKNGSTAENLNAVVRITRVI